ncbi:MAG: MFS transporter [Candidatus Binataceae bacterium]
METTQPREARRSYPLGIFGRTPPFTRRQGRVFLIACTAGFFDNYDRALLSLALKQIQKGLAIADAHLGAVLSLIRLGYIFSLLVTPLADVFGRRRLLLYTIAGYTIFTGLSAIAPSEHAFVACQAAARAFACAEATIAVVILAEEVDAAVRGWAVGLLAAVSTSGYGLAALVFALINVMPYGWRGLYALALIPLMLIIPLRRTLPESKRFAAEALPEIRPARILEPLIAVFRAYPRRLGMLLAVAFLSAMGGNAAGIFFPKFLQEAHGWSPSQVASMFFIGGALGILGNIIAGRLSDRFGRRTMSSVFMLLAPIMTIFLYRASAASALPGWSLALPLGLHLHLPRVPGVIPLWIFELFFDTASSTILTAYSAELFPTSHRATAGSALAVAGTLGGALGLALESVLYRASGSHWSAIRHLTIFWMIAPVIMFLFFPETAGSELESIAPEAPSRQPAH